MAFSITELQYNNLLKRITALELQANDTAVAIGNLVTLMQVNELKILLEADIQDFDARLQALENRITAIEEEPIS